MAAEVLAYPLMIDPSTGSFAKVTQDTNLYKANQIAAFVRTLRFERPVFESYGIDDPTFGSFNAESFAENFGHFYEPDVISISDIVIGSDAGASSKINVSFT